LILWIAAAPGMAGWAHVPHSATFDGGGSLTQRVWKSPNGATNRTQTLSWTATGRLLKVSERDSSNSGQDWSAVCDAMNRRLQTSQVIVTNSVALTDQPIVVSHYFDPQFEFLELGQTEGGRTTWKVMGPDTDGTYGGQNGTGGFEAIVPAATLFCPVVSDALGNVLSVYDGAHGGLVWNQSRPAAYGAVPGYRPLPAGSPGSNIVGLVVETNYRNREIESINLMWLGGNWYDPTAGQFVSPDPLGHAASPSLYSFCGGDPIDIWDLDGRWGENLFQTLFPATAAAAGARPYTGSLRGDLQVSGAFYGATLPIQVPSRVFTSEPVQRGLQVVGGAAEAVAGAAAIPGSGGVATTVGIAAILHGDDSIAAGLIGQPSLTSQGLTYLTGSSTWGSALDAGLGVGLNFGAGMLRASVTAEATIFHVTSFERSLAIAESQLVTGEFGIFGFEGRAPQSPIVRAWLVGAGDRSASVAITGDAMAAFQEPPLVGPYAILRDFLGVRSTGLGTLDLAGQNFLPNQVLRNGSLMQATADDIAAFQGHQWLVNYAADAAIGAGRVASGTVNGYEYGIATQGLTLSKH
jgi:RHS repeat-associated protein